MRREEVEKEGAVTRNLDTWATLPSGVGRSFPNFDSSARTLYSARALKRALFINSLIVGLYPPT
jgi:hypothetical protein